MTHGLRGVLDWELAHRGNPVEDIGWLCARAWRFGGPGRVGGFGELDAFLAAYHAAGGRAVDADEVRWWEVYASVKWAVICMLQAGTHLRGSTRSVELAAIGRRVCECEWDILGLLGVDTASVAEDETGNGAAPASPLFGSPSAAELLEAVRGVHRDQGDGVHRRTGPLRGPGGPQRAGHGRPRTGSRTGGRGRPRRPPAARSGSGTTPRW